MVAFSRPFVESDFNVKWWEQMAGGQYYVKVKVGFRPELCELIYMKYMKGDPFMSRTVLWYTLAFLKQYPKSGDFDSLGPQYSDSMARRMVRKGARFVLCNTGDITLQYGDAMARRVVRKGVHFIFRHDRDIDGPCLPPMQPCSPLSGALPGVH